MKQHCIGFDLGNFHSRATNLQKEFSCLSVVSYGVEHTTEDLRESKVLDFYGDIRVGDTSIPHVRHKDDNWLESPEILYLFQMGLSELIPPDEDLQEVFAVCAIPYNLFRYSAGHLAKHLSGNHSFARRGAICEHNLRVRVVEKPQGLTTLYRELLNNEGQPANLLSLEQVAVIDIGSRDVNIIACKEFQILPHMSETLHEGCWNLIEALRKSLSRAFNRPSLSEFEVEQALRTGLFWAGSDYIPIDEYVEDEKTRFIQKILTACQRLWPDVNAFRRIYITGGGSLLIGKELEFEFAQAQLCSNPIFSNCTGAAKFARRAGL
jgi:hypothetical protein